MIDRKEYLAQKRQEAAIKSSLERQKIEASHRAFGGMREYLAALYGPTPAKKKAPGEGA